jgi:hypothetical protein
MKIGGFGITAPQKAANLLNGATSKFKTTNLSTVGFAIFRLLSKRSSPISGRNAKRAKRLEKPLPALG